MRIEELGDKCTGCGTCFNICRNHCIEMKPDREGFLKPVINAEKCVQCGECDKSCRVIQRLSYKEIVKIKPYPTYVGHSISREVVERSTSGGIFTELAQYIIDKGGIVYGAAYNAQNHVEHIRVDCIEALWRLNGSKYVQSETGRIFKRVEDDLCVGKIVLFSGCGCQISALRSYLKKEYINLYMVAIVCHGVPSPGVWDDYISRYQNVEQINFRDKRNRGWEDYVFSIKTKESEYSWEDCNNPYSYSFINDIIVRKSCFECKFKSYRCDGDLMIGDAWGIQYSSRKMYNQRGTSLIIAYSDKGDQLIDNIRNKVNIRQVYDMDIYRHNPRIIKSIKMQRQRRIFDKMTIVFPKLFCMYYMYFRSKHG